MRITVSSKHRTSHFLHFLLTVFTCGSWAIVWAAVVIFNMVRPSMKTHVDATPREAPVSKEERAAGEARRDQLSAEAKAGRARTREERKRVEALESAARKAERDERSYRMRQRADAHIAAQKAKYDAGWAGKLERHNAQVKADRLAAKESHPNG
jgi:biopolymer transport protein ExbB/TolQ